MAKTRLGRPLKLTPELMTEIGNLLTLGCTVEDMCARVAINKTTFYRWVNTSRDLVHWADEQVKANRPLPLATSQDVLFCNFHDAVVRAQSAARITATAAIRTALSGYSETETTTETFTETRLRKTAEGGEEPYTYTRTVTRRTITEHAPDWRAAVEYLKRRDPANWQPPAKVEITWQDQAVADIRAGLVTYEALSEAFDESIAAELFSRAGVSPSLITSEDEKPI